MTTIIFYLMLQLGIFLTPEQFNALPSEQQTNYEIIIVDELQH